MSSLMVKAQIVANLHKAAFGTNDFIVLDGAEMGYEAPFVVIAEIGTEWTYLSERPANITEYAQKNGLYLEAVNHYTLGVFAGVTE